MIVASRTSWHFAKMDDAHWTYDEWAANTVEKIVSVALAVSEDHRGDWLRVQIELALAQALLHGRSGRSNSDPVVA